VALRKKLHVETLVAHRILHRLQCFGELPV
jgi:hypothetical protein